MREILNRYTLGELTAVYRREGDVVELLLVPAGSEGSIARADCAAEPLIQAKLTEDDAPAFFSGGRTMRNSPTVKAIRYTGQTAQKSADKTVVVTKLTDPRGLAYTHTLTLYADNPAAEVVTSVENTGSAPVTFEMLSSFTLGSLSPFSAGLAPETLKIHRLRSTWSAEDLILHPNAFQVSLPAFRYTHRCSPSIYTTDCSSVAYPDTVSLFFASPCPRSHAEAPSVSAPEASYEDC